MFSKKGLAILLILFFVVLWILSGCSSDEIKSGEKLTISGFGEEIELSLGEIKKFDEVNLEVDSINSDDEKERRKVKGVLLEDIIGSYFEKGMKDVASLRFYAGDGYSVEIPGEVLESEKIILAYGMDGKPLKEWEKPLRSVVTNQRTMYWVKNLVKVGLNQQEVSLIPDRIIFIDTLVKNVPAFEYEYYGHADEAVKVDDLLCDFNFRDLSENVAIKSSDGLEKSEEEGIFNSGAIKIDGSGSPAFLSDSLPRGMWVKNILWFRYERTTYFSCQEGLEYFKKSKVGRKEGIAMGDVFKEVGLGEADSYSFTASDGFKLNIQAEDIGQALIYFNQDKELELSLSGGEGKILKNLLLTETD
ncbi:MAG: molybdopterin-dependent oxidoreductase [Candidatus Humimicrobiaceae bacterium]